MNCPLCGHMMVEKNLGGVKVDICEDGCGGIWLDWNELGKLDEKNEGFGPLLAEILHRRTVTTDRGREPLDCPKCGIPMHEHKYKHSKQADVDECYGCGGFFLDAGELGAIRDTFLTDKEKTEYVNGLIKDIPEFALAEEDLEKKKLRVKAIKGFTNFIRLKR